MPKLISSNERYEFSLDELKRMIAEELGASTSAVSVNFEFGYPPDDDFSGSGYSHPHVTGLSVTVSKL